GEHGEVGGGRGFDVAQQGVDLRQRRGAARDPALDGRALGERLLRELGLLRVEILDERVGGELLPRRLGFEAARDEAQRVEAEAVADGVEAPGQIDDVRDSSRATAKARSRGTPFPTSASTRRASSLRSESGTVSTMCSASSAMRGAKAPISALMSSARPRRNHAVARSTRRPAVSSISA